MLPAGPSGVAAIDEEYRKSYEEACVYRLVARTFDRSRTDADDDLSDGVGDVGAQEKPCHRRAVRTSA